MATILFLLSWYKPLEIVLAKKTTELILLFHKNITKLVFLWPNMGQKSFKVLSERYYYTYLYYLDKKYQLFLNIDKKF